MVAALLPNADPLHKVTIVPRGRALGVTMQLPESGPAHAHARIPRAQVAMLMGGRVAEELFMRHMTSGAGNDIERATDIARRMVCEFGMSALGPSPSAARRAAARPDAPGSARRRHAGGRGHPRGGDARLRDRAAGARARHPAVRRWPRRCSRTSRSRRPRSRHCWRSPARRSSAIPGRGRGAGHKKGDPAGSPFFVTSQRGACRSRRAPAGSAACGWGVRSLPAAASGWTSPA